MACLLQSSLLYRVVGTLESLIHVSRRRWRTRTPTNQPPPTRGPFGVEKGIQVARLSISDPSSAFHPVYLPSRTNGTSGTSGKSAPEASLAVRPCRCGVMERVVHSDERHHIGFMEAHEKPPSLESARKTKSHPKVFGIQTVTGLKPGLGVFGCIAFRVFGVETNPPGTRQVVSCVGHVVNHS